MRGLSIFFRFVVAIVGLFGSVSTWAAVSFSGPAPYKSFDDSPFNSLITSYFYVEDFEDDPLGASVANSPGLTVSNGAVIGQAINTDSVDGDDGAIDGFGRDGKSWYPGARSVRFTFDTGILGKLPSHVGVVWTDVGLVLPPDTTVFDGDVEIEVYDGSGASLGAYGPYTLGDGVSVDGFTDEDRFFGAVYAGGIGAIEIRMPNSIDWEIDHLQYGAAETTPVPLPMGMMWIFAASLFGILRRYGNLQKA